MTTEALPKLYLITDRARIPDDRQLTEIVEELLQAGLRMVQLREKDLSAAALYPLAKELRALTRRYDSLLLINDRIDVAQAVDADGVHLGGHSLPIRVARKILGPEALIGASTHSREELDQAIEQGADFATYGPVFFTPSKISFGEPVGIESLQNMCRISTIPIYALGGITTENIGSVASANAHGIAAISSLLAVPSPHRAYAQLAAEL